jgi:hypothetical protein
MDRVLKYSAIGLVVALTACYHATIDTGRSPSPEVINEPWATGFVYGLVPPKTVETMARCPNGVSKVETFHSFLNSLVGGLTFGIFTPMTIKVTCAASGGASIPAGASHIQLGDNPTPQQLQDAVTRAAVESFLSGLPVYIDH